MLPKVLLPPQELPLPREFWKTTEKTIHEIKKFPNFEILSKNTMFGHLQTDYSSSSFTNVIKKGRGMRPVKP
jgi:hypothetical protein